MIWKLRSASLVFGCLILGSTPSAFAAEPNSKQDPSNDGFEGKIIPIANDTGSCLSELRAFNAKTDKEGSWLGGSLYGFGYPAFGWGYGYGYNYSVKSNKPANIGFQSARPGYEVRTLLLAANMLAQHGQEQPCKDVLSTANAIYEKYLIDTHDDDRQMIDRAGWRKQQIADASSLAEQIGSIRSDQLLGTEMRNAKDEALGSVSDIVMSPTNGKIAYLIVARGGLFGIDQKYVPVPFADIKATPKMNILVVDTTKATMDAAPDVKRNSFSGVGQYDEVSQQVEVYWKSHLASKMRD